METSVWFSNNVFTAAGGHRLLSSLVNTKAKPQLPADRTNTLSCWEGSPKPRVHGGGGVGGGGVVAAQGAVVCFPGTALSVTHAKASPPVHQWLAFKSPFS